MGARSACLHSCDTVRNVRRMGVHARRRERACTAWLQAYFMQPARCSWLFANSQLAHSFSGQPSCLLNHGVKTARLASGAPQLAPSSLKKTSRTKASAA